MIWIITLSILLGMNILIYFQGFMKKIPEHRWINLLAVVATIAGIVVRIQMIK